MILHDPETNCSNARLYFYDFLNKENSGGIPEDALQHIKQCQNCQEEIGSLQKLLVKADERINEEQSHKDSAITTLLSLHFEHTGEPVKCNLVKLFLASLVDPVLQIKIPTPITEHIDKCTACRDDLKTLLELQLPHRHLVRLGQILAEEPGEDGISCSDAQATIPAVVSMNFDETNAETLKHLCKCPDCRKTIYSHRGNVKKNILLNGGYQNGFPCDSLSPTDIYDLCLPYGINPPEELPDEQKEQLISHLRKCPQCIAKMQHLHRTISDIAEREESEIVTVYDLEESESYAALEASPDTAEKEDNSPTQQPKQKTTASNVKPLFKIGLAAAAVIVIGLALLFTSPPASATTFENIYRAIRNVKNVCIKSYTDKMELKQEIWVSRSSKVYLTKTGIEFVLSDLTNEVRIVKDVNKGSIKSSPLPAHLKANIEESMSGFMGLVPFTDISDKPSNAEWNSIENSDPETAEDTEIYELSWSKETTTGSLFKKRRFFVDTKSSLPKRTESYTKRTTDDDYVLDSINTIESLSDEEMAAEIEKASS